MASAGVMQKQQQQAQQQSSLAVLSAGQNFMLSQRDFMQEQQASADQEHEEQLERQQKGRTLKSRLQQGDFYQNASTRQQAVGATVSGQQSGGSGDQVARAGSLDDQKTSPTDKEPLADSEPEAGGQRSAVGATGQEEARPETSLEGGEPREPGKHHVGPVMGIFFKVWSLVKGE